MLISYRRTGGVVALLTFAGVAIAATVLTVAVAATLLIVAVAVAAAALLVRAVRPTSWRRHTMTRAARWSQDTIEATVVGPARGSPDQPDLARTNRLESERRER
jgi:hypothetical protein